VFKSYDFQVRGKLYSSSHTFIVCSISCAWYIKGYTGMRLKLIASAVLVFLLISVLEGWAGYWLVGRWFISSRHASITLGKVKQWMDRGLVTASTQQVKIFFQRNGKWILLTLALNQVIPEVQRRIQATQYCYVFYNSTGAYAVIQSYSSRVFVSYADNSRSSQFWTYEYSCDGWSRDGSYPVSFPLYYVYRLESGGLQFWAYLPSEISLTLRSRDSNVVTCTVQTRWLLPLRECGSPADNTWQNEMRKVPVRVFPNPSDFLRDDIISQDPALRWLRDEYQRIASDSSIPLIPADALDGVELPSIDWTIPEEEALDETSSTSQSSDQTTDTPTNIPGFDTDLPNIQKRPFPVELLNNIVHNHPLLRILTNVNFDAGSGGSCRVGSGVFTIEFCDHAWVLNLMGAIIVPVSFLVGLFGWRND